MPQKFKMFVILAEMRTGSNLLEDNLAAFEGLSCYGEVFNPIFVGRPDRPQLFGMTLEDRQADPEKMLRRLRQKPDGIGGFRYFTDHEPRVFEPLIEDATCAKVILRRDPLDSFVSLQIAAQTGQWKLTNEAHRKTVQITFDPAAFRAYLDALRIRDRSIRHALQVAGQAAFEISYGDLQDINVVNGLAAYIGSTQRRAELSDRLKRQNPGSTETKVTNPEEMLDTARSLGLRP